MTILNDFFFFTDVMKDLFLSDFRMYIPKKKKKTRSTPRQGLDLWDTVHARIISRPSFLIDKTLCYGDEHLDFYRVESQGSRASRDSQVGNVPV